MAHENKLIVQYVTRIAREINTVTDEYIWNAHRFTQEIDSFGNLVVSKMPNPPEAESHKIHEKK